VEVRGVVELWLGAAGQAQQQHLLAQPREALRLAQTRPCWAGDPRLSAQGNRTARQLSRLLEELLRWLAWLRCPGVLRLAQGDGPLLRSALGQLLQHAGSVRDETSQLLQDLEVP
jgi:hypothetical protein